jgi:hypothetical protein
MRGEEKVRVTPEAASRSLRFIEQSYARRKPMEMAWLSEPENQKAALHQPLESKS